jgi:hypothetical protein
MPACRFGNSMFTSLAPARYAEACVLPVHAGHHAVLKSIEARERYRRTAEPPASTTACSAPLCRGVVPETSMPQCADGTALFA